MTLWITVRFVRMAKIQITIVMIEGIAAPKKSIRILSGLSIKPMLHWGMRISARARV